MKNLYIIKGERSCGKTYTLSKIIDSICEKNKCGILVYSEPSKRYINTIVKHKSLTGLFKMYEYTNLVGLDILYVDEFYAIRELFDMPYYYECIDTIDNIILTLNNYDYNKYGDYIKSKFTNHNIIVFTMEKCYEENNKMDCVNCKYFLSCEPSTLGVCSSYKPL